MKAIEKVRDAGEFLKRSGIDNPLKDAELIIVHCLGIDRVSLYKDNPDIREDAMSVIEAFLRRRTEREPLQYILGYAEFLGLTIRVGPGVLIPRPETELLVEEAVKKMRALKTQSSKLRILDLCTGSGCIVLALAREFPDAEGYGTDTSETAIHYAEENAKMNAVYNVTFLRGSLFEPIHRHFNRQKAKSVFTLIISNPPYIRTGDMKDLQPEIRDWEPEDALNGGEDGLDYYRTIIPEAKKYLTTQGALIFEIGINQAEAVKKIARASGYEHIAVRKDYAGIDRIVAIEQ